MNLRRIGVVVAQFALALLLTRCAAAATEDTPLLQQLQQQLGQVAKDVGDLKARGSSEWIAILGALAGLAGAGLGAWATTRGGKATSEAHARQARDQLIGQRRVEVYARLFKEFSDFSRDPLPQPLPSKARLRTLISEMTKWYYESGGGLVMSTLCQKVFLRVRKLLIAFVDGIKSDRLEEGDFLAVYVCCSRLRTALIYDVDGRRSLGGAPEEDAERDLRAFLRLAYSDDPGEAIQFFARQQRADDAAASQG